MFGNKLFDNVGFPTPEDIPVECAYRLAKLPSSAAWLGTFMGLLEHLLDEENWQQLDGGITRAAAAAVWSDIISDMYANAEAGVIVDVRQSPTDPCFLEKTTDGSTWVQFADLRLCRPVLQTGLQGLEVDDGFGFYRVPDGAWVNDPVDVMFDNAVPVGAALTQTNDLCVAAANAAYFLYRLKQAIAEQLVDVAAATGSRVSLGLESLVAEVFGAVTAGYVSLALALVFEGVAAIFQVTDFTQDDLRKLTCLIQDNMVGSDGAWSLNFGAIYGGLAGAGISSDVVNVLHVMLDQIGENGLNLAAKTTAISAYSCAAGTYATLDDHAEVNQQFVTGTNTRTIATHVLSARWGFTRIKVFAVPATWSPQPSSGVLPGEQNIGSGPTSTSFGVGEYLYANPTVYATDAAAKAAASAAYGVPSASINLLARTNNLGVGQWPEWNFKLNTTAGTFHFIFDTYTAYTFAACP